MPLIVVILFWFFVLGISLTVLIKSADYFVSYAENLGYKFKIPAFIIGATIVAFGTSLPELAVGIISVLKDQSEIVVGTVVGSNISNVFFITGIAILISTGFSIKFRSHRIEYLLLIFATLLFSYFLWDKEMNIVEGLIGLLMLIIFIVYVVLYSDAQTEESNNAVTINWRKTLFFIVSIAGIWLGADFTIKAIVAISSQLNLGNDIVAQTVVALGTSLPELAVTGAAARKGHYHLIMGNVIGSNIFNLLIVVSIPVIIGSLTNHPFVFSDDSFNQFSVPIMILSTMLLVIAGFFKKTPKTFGVLFLLLYIFFMVGSFMKIRLLDLLF